jgi:hypothetical protein
MTLFRLAIQFQMVCARKQGNIINEVKWNIIFLFGCILSKRLNNYLLLKMVKNEQEMGILQVERNGEANIL